MHGSTRSLVGLGKRQRRRGSGLGAKNWIRPTSGAEGGSQARWVDIIGIRRRPACFAPGMYSYDGGLDQAQGCYVNRIVFYFILSVQANIKLPVGPRHFWKHAALLFLH